MKITGKVTDILAKTTGTSKAGKDWTKQEFVITTDGQYPKTVAFTMFNKEVTFSKGDTVEVDYAPESREYNGKYYTTLIVFEVTTTKATAKPTWEPAEVVEDIPEQDLPF
jgi:hypothetical protein